MDLPVPGSIVYLRKPKQAGTGEGAQCSTSATKRFRVTIFEYAQYVTEIEASSHDDAEDDALALYKREVQGVKPLSFEKHAETNGTTVEEIDEG
jgi:hypothetical protein